MRSRALLLALLPLLVAAGRGFHNDALKVRAFDPPVGWELQPIGSYPRLVAAWESKSGGRLTLVAQPVRGDSTARSLAEESRPALERQGFRSVTVSDERTAADEGQRVRLDASIEDGRRFVRQLYTVAAGLGYVVTIVGPIGKAPELRRDFDEAAATLLVGDAASGAPVRR